MSIRTSARVLAAASLVAIVGGVTACATGGAGSTSLTSSDQRSLEATAGEAEVVAVMMTADWCPPCRTLKPNVQQAMTSMPYNSVAIVYADYTDRRDPAAMETLAEAGLSSLYESNGGKTGVVYLLDADSGAILGQVSGGSASASEIKTALEAAVQAAG